MTFENIQTAIGRATDFNLIHLDGIRKNYESEYSNFKEIECFENSNFSTIYETFCEETGFKYVGQTSRLYEDRFDEEITNINCIVYKKMKNPDCKIIGYVRGSKKFIDGVEREFITEYKNKYGDKYINLINFDILEDKEISLGKSEITTKIYEKEDRYILME